MVTSPLTQEVWTWDRFLHGGQDFESGVLLVLVSLCLVLLLAQLITAGRGPGACRFEPVGTRMQPTGCSTAWRYIPQR